MRAIRTAFALVVPFAAGPAYADAPPAAFPATFCSLTGKVCATRDTQRRSTLIWLRGAAGKPVVLWRAPIAPANAQVSDDGQTLVEFYPGANLLELAAGPRTTVIVFHRYKTKPVVVRLGQVVARPAALPRTVSHRVWASAYGFDGHGRFVLETAEGKHFAFDRAGRVVKGSLLHS